MVDDNPEPGVPGVQPAIVEIELGSIAFIAHRELQAVEMTITAPDGAGVRTWVGIDVAPITALHFVGAVMRLISGDPT